MSARDSHSRETIIHTVEPFEVHPLPLAEHLLTRTPWWRVFRRRRLKREITRLERESWEPMPYMQFECGRCGHGLLLTPLTDREGFVGRCAHHDCPNRGVVVVVTPGPQEAT